MDAAARRVPGRSVVTSAVSVEVKGADGLGDGFLLRLLERLFEAPRERVVAPALRVHRLFEERLPAAFLLLQDALRVVERGQVARRRLTVGDDPAQVQIDDQRRATTGASDFSFALQVGHDVPRLRHAVPPLLCKSSW